MSASLLATKLFIPHPQTDHVLRPRLLQELDKGLDAGVRLLLVSAPAGYGKTTLLVEWRESLKDKGERIKDKESSSFIPNPSSFILSASSFIPSPLFAWLSLEKEDNDPVKFWTYVLAAVQTAVPGFGEALLKGLQAPQPGSFAALLPELVNALAGLPGRLVLVLDDYHAITSQAIHQGLAFLLDHLPPQVTLVIATRADPPLPLARLRARGQVVNLRLDDLRFTAEETSAFLEKRLSLKLSPADVAALEGRTEGWIAGLQMAAFSLRSAGDASAFIQAFSGSNRYVLDYLLEEVLAAQPQEIQTFLLCTSVLERLCGPLVEEVLKDQGEKSVVKDKGERIRDRESSSFIPYPFSFILDQLERSNLFLIPLDEERMWYRYHHLFADLLQARLRATLPEQIPSLHRRAAEWFQKNGFIEEAIRHALQAGDASRAAEWIEADLDEKMRSNQFPATFWLIKDLPQAEIDRRPLLAISRAFECTFSGQIRLAQPLLDQAEEVLTSISEPGPEVPRLLGIHAAVSALAAEAEGDYPRVVEMAERADRLLPEGDVFHTVVPYTLSRVALASGDLETAEKALVRQRKMALATGETSTIAVATVSLADLKKLQGRLHEAGALYRELIRLVTQARSAWVGNVATLRIPWGAVLLEWNDLAGVREILESSLPALRSSGYPIDLARACLLETRYYLATDDLEAGQRALDRAVESSHLFPASPDFEVEAGCLQVELMLEQYKTHASPPLSRIERQARDLAGAAPQPPLREQAELALTRVLIAAGALEEAVPLLERIARSARSGGRLGLEIKAETLLALAHQKQGRSDLARTTLMQALLLAEAEGYVRVFLDEGDEMRALIAACRSAIDRKEHPGLASYLTRLQTAFGEPADHIPSHGAAQPLVEPLTDRELEVLELLAQGLTNQAIAGRLVIATGTVKRHTANIFAKLEVANRTEAVARARALGLVG